MRSEEAGRGVQLFDKQMRCGSFSSHLRIQLKVHQPEWFTTPNPLFSDVKMSHSSVLPASNRWLFKLAFAEWMSQAFLNKLWIRALSILSSATSVAVLPSMAPWLTGLLTRQWCMNVNPWKPSAWTSCCGCVEVLFNFFDTDWNLTSHSVCRLDHLTVAREYNLSCVISNHGVILFYVLILSGPLPSHV